MASLVLACLVLSAGVNRELGGWGAFLLAGFSLLWLAVNGSMEGVVLVVLAPSHGFTGADLAGVAGLVLAAYRGWAWYQAART